MKKLHYALPNQSFEEVSTGPTSAYMSPSAASDLSPAAATGASTDGQPFLECNAVAVLKPIRFQQLHEALARALVRVCEPDADRPRGHYAPGGGAGASGDVSRSKNSFVGGLGVSGPTSAGSDSDGGDDTDEETKGPAPAPAPAPVATKPKAKKGGSKLDRLAALAAASAGLGGGEDIGSGETKQGADAASAVATADGEENAGDAAKPKKKGTKLGKKAGKSAATSATATAVAAAASADEEKAEAQHPYPLRILIAEDTEVNMKVMVRLLMRMGYDPVCVNNGADAVSQVLGRPIHPRPSHVELDPQTGAPLVALEREKPERGYDVVLMDVQMPIQDGVHATREIISHFKQSAAYRPPEDGSDVDVMKLSREVASMTFNNHDPQTQGDTAISRAASQLAATGMPNIIALTASALRSDCEACENAGMHDFLSKPVDVTTLKQTLQLWSLRRRGLLQGPE